MTKLSIKIDANGNPIKNDTQKPLAEKPDSSFGENITPPTHHSNDKENYNNLIIPKWYIILGVVFVAAVCFWLFYNPKNEVIINSAQSNDPNHDIEEQQLIQDCEDVFKTKNIARAKAMFVKALSKYPDNEGIRQRIEECNKILRQSNYMVLLQAREKGKLGFADKDGYIVIDFLYDQEVERKSEMMILKTGDKFGVVGGTVKDCSSTKYIKAEWIAEELSYRMLKNQTGDCDFVHIVDGKLIVDEY